MEDITRRRLYKKRRRKMPRRIALLAGLTVMSGAFAYVAMCPGVKQSCPYSANNGPKLMPMSGPACDDAIEGVWEGTQYLYGHKYLFTLDVKRTSPNSPHLTGTISSHYWQTSSANASAKTPPTCDESNPVNQTVIAMNASGSFHNNNFVFEGKNWELKEQTCGTFGGGYYPDGFTGFLQGSDTILTINNDGSNPTTRVGLRRISCGENQAAVPKSDCWR